VRQRTLLKEIQQSRAHFGVNTPETSFAGEIPHGEQVLVHFGERLVERQIVSNRVLPRAGRHIVIVHKRLTNPRVDVFHGETFAFGRLNGEKDQAAERERRLVRVVQVIQR